MRKFKIIIETGIAGGDFEDVFEMDYFPETKKSMMYRNGRKAIFLPMRVSDIMGNDKLQDELRVRASC
ncbi:TPA: hypothetical protein L3458_003452 [Escherichia coli]|nr:hypothetical protein [Escherichia coli]